MKSSGLTSLLSCICVTVTIAASTAQRADRRAQSGDAPGAAKRQATSWIDSNADLLRRTNQKI